MAVTSITLWGKTDPAHLHGLEVNRLGFAELLACSFVGLSGTFTSQELCKVKSVHLKAIKGVLDQSCPRMKCW